ncbi:unnamed protein product [Trichobilharzia szidati]|nr:unnamed protein product [Trichobilharzia szidati]
MIHKVIKIYNDLGASDQCLIHLKNSINYNYSSHSLSLSCEEINGVTWNQYDSTAMNQTDLICIGGGYDLGYLKSLNIEGCLKLQKYIKENHGKYLGICAGAYFASDYCQFDKNGPLEVCGERYIKLFRGTAIGPVYPGFQYNSESGSYAVPIEATLETLCPQKTVVYYNGGCTFESTNWENSRVLYKYSDNGKPAIISSNLGNGYGILSGVHFEYDPYLLEKQICAGQNHLDNNNHSYEVIETLKANNLTRLQLFKTLIELLLSDSNSSCSELFSV